VKSEPNPRNTPLTPKQRRSGKIDKEMNFEENSYSNEFGYTFDSGVGSDGLQQRINRKSAQLNIINQMTPEE
jgi:hypothetical protein